MSRIKEILPPALLIAGTAIGVGILGLPVDVGMAGLLPACIGLLAVMGIMYISGVVIAETYTQSENKEADFPSLVENVLGRYGKYIIVIGYLIVFWGMLVAYYTAGSLILSDILPWKIPSWIVIITFFLPITIILFFGIKYVLRLNAIIMFLLLISFLTLLILASKGIEPTRFKYNNWSYFIGTLPILLCTVAYQNTIPSISHRFKGDLKKIRLSIILGLGLIGIICFLWLLTVIGALPLLGKYSIDSAFKDSQPATIPLSLSLQSKWITFTGLFFSLTAIATSYISISIGMLRFFKDIFSSMNENNRKILSILLTFLPPFAISIISPHIFLEAMDIVGGVGVVLLFGIIPGLILIKQNKSLKHLCWGIIILLLFLGILGLEIAQEAGMLKVPVKADTNRK